MNQSQTTGLRIIGNFSPGAVKALDIINVLVGACFRYRPTVGIYRTVSDSTTMSST